MKHAEKNEFDLLLRALARRERASGATAAGKQGPSVEHLDADELSSYAEDVLPSAARARYTAHLADCESCRKTVTQLTFATGATARREVMEKTTSTSFWQKLAVLFSPAVLRYAAPALAVFAVVAISFLVLREQEQPSFVARNEQPASANESVATQDTVQQDKREGFIAPQPEPETASATPQQPSASNTKDAQKPTEKKGQEGQAAGAGANVAADANTPAKAPPSESQRTYAPEPVVTAAAPPAPQPKAGAVAVTQSADKEREQVAKDDATGVKREDTRRRERDEISITAEERASGRKMQEVPSAARSTRGLRKNEESDADKKAKTSVATRSVGGRQFRREDNAWIDTAYDSSRALVNVRRGSEQYRALMADESGLKSIVETLDGTVIVVWKGRAYRFQ